METTSFLCRISPKGIVFSIPPFALKHKKAAGQQGVFLKKRAVPEKFEKNS